MKGTPSVVTNGLPELALKINREHSGVVEHASLAVEHALRCGELLREAKKQIGHGEWGEWIKANCRFSYRTARVYMRIAERRASLPEPKWQRVAKMPLRQALMEIAETEPKVEDVSWNSDFHDRFMAKGRRLRRELLGLRVELDEICNSKEAVEFQIEKLQEIIREAKEGELQAFSYRMEATRYLGQLANELLPYFDSNGHIRATDEVKREVGPLLREIEANAWPFLKHFR